jgi:hypothetical protein
VVDASNCGRRRTTNPAGTRQAHRIAFGLLAGLASLLFIAAAACSNHAHAPTAADRPAARSSLAAFFEGSELGLRASMVEDGSHLRSTLEMATRRAPLKGATVRVVAVEPTGRDLVVSYDVLIDGQLTLPQVTSRAVRAGDRWILSRDSFCALVAIGGVTCPK